jgi:hypothetical protein
MPAWHDNRIVRASPKAPDRNAKKFRLCSDAPGWGDQSIPVQTRRRP